MNDSNNVKLKPIEPFSISEKQKHEPEKIQIETANKNGSVSLFFHEPGPEKVSGSILADLANVVKDVVAIATSPEGEAFIKDLLAFIADFKSK